MKRFEKRVTLVLLVGAGFFVLSTTLALISLLRLVDANRWVQHTLKVIAQAEEIVNSLTAAEASFRGYVISPDRRFLKGYLESHEHVPALISTLKTYTSDNPDQRKHFAELEPLVTARFEQMQKAIEQVGENHADEARLMIIEGKGRELQEQIKAELDQIKSDEEALLVLRQSAESNVSGETIWWIGIAGGAGILLNLMTIRMFYRNRRRRELAERQLLDRTQELETSELALRREATTLQTVFDAVTDGIIVCDETGRCLYQNPSAIRMLNTGFQGEAVKDFNDRFVVYEGDGEHLYNVDETPLRRAMKGLATDGVELIIEDSATKNRTFLNVSGRPLVFPDQSQRGAVAIMHDIGDQRRHDIELQRANAALTEQKSELEVANAELESFSYSVSHDLRAPLRAINGFADILFEDFGAGLDQEARRLLGVIRKNTRQMGFLIDDLLKFSRLIRANPVSSPVSMQRLAKAIWDSMAPAAEEGRKVELRLGALPPALADTSLIRQVLTNLIANALKFTRDQPAPVVQIDWYVDGEFNVYFVRDNGVGFDMKYAHQLFGVFHRLHTSNEFEGTGVGLAIVKRIVERFGGKVWTEARIGEGATFYFSLPKSMSSSASGKVNGQIGEDDEDERGKSERSADLIS